MLEEVKKILDRRALKVHFIFPFDKLKSVVRTNLVLLILTIFVSGMMILQLVLANPGAEVMKKLDKAKFIENIGQEWIYLTVGEAVEACNFMLHTCKPNAEKEKSEAWNNV